jgi:hypothetical protein
MNRSVHAACIAALATSLLLATDASAVDVRGSVRAAEAPKTKPVEGVRAPYWQEWNGFIDPKKAGVDYAREVTAVLVGAPELRDATSIALRDGTLSPSTIVVQNGTTLRIRNEDDFIHELYAEGLKEFDAVETTSGATRTIQLLQTGVFTLRDRLSPHVHGTLHVVAKITLVAQPNGEGSFVFKDVPPGKYTLKLYRGASEVTASEVEVAGSKDIVLEPVLLEASASKPKPGK